MVASMVRRFFDAKLRNSAKRCDNQFGAHQLLKTRSATGRKTTQILLVELQISRSEPAELCRHSPYESRF
jgi:hypothetical protein